MSIHFSAVWTQLQRKKGKELPSQSQKEIPRNGLVLRDPSSAKIKA